MNVVITDTWTQTPKVEVRHAEVQNRAKMKDKVTQDERVIFKDNAVQVKQAVNESVSQTYTNS